MSLTVPLAPLFRLISVVAAGVERQQYPEWFPPEVCLGGVLRCEKGCRAGTRGVLFQKGTTYHIRGVRFPELDRGEERHALVLFQDPLDRRHNVVTQVRLRDLRAFHENGTLPVRAGVGWQHHAEFKVVRSGPYVWHGPTPPLHAEPAPTLA